LFQSDIHNVAKELPQWMFPSRVWNRTKGLIFTESTMIYQDKDY